jgi:bifunctional non-homologous end joining protein LigD
VKYGQWTDDLHLRAPVFLSLRSDRGPKDCTFDAVQPTAKPVDGQDPPESSAMTGRKAKGQSKSKKAAEPSSVNSHEIDVLEPDNPRKPAKSTASAKTRKASSSSELAELRDGKSETLDIESDGQRLHFSNLNKIYFPELRVKKRELLAYYYHMADFILPFLKDRPIVMRRYPDGVDGKAFFQKEAPSYLPDWIETATVYSDERGGDMQYVLANNRATLLYLTNLGCIDHNPWSSRADSQDHPDYVFFDLDPTPGTPFSDVMHIAKEIHVLLKSIKMNHYLKTSGASGFHIFLPLVPEYTYEQTRTFADVVARIVSAANPKLTTSERTVSKRPDGRIMIDALQNARGKPLACVYSARAFPKATISTPLHPDELTPKFNVEKWNLRNFDDRLNLVGDLWKDFWQKRQTLDRGLNLLAQKFSNP